VSACLDESEAAHVLYLSGHGRLGAIEPEDDDGNARALEAERFVAEAIPPSGCRGSSRCWPATAMLYRPRVTSRSPQR
jgi:hypothetical protein